jgi:hypothetical protein
MDGIRMLISQNIDLGCWWKICEGVLSVLVALNMGKYNIDGELGTKGANALNDIMIQMKVGKCRCLLVLFKMPLDILEDGDVICINRKGGGVSNNKRMHARIHLQEI